MRGILEIRRYPEFISKSERSQALDIITPCVYADTVINAIFFCAGLVVGLALSVPILAVFWMGAYKAAQLKSRGELLVAQTNAMNMKKRVDASIAKLRSMNPDMTWEQEEIAKDTLEKTFISRYQTSTTERQTPVSRD